MKSAEKLLPVDVTLHADASFHHKSGAGGWAVWIKGAQGRIIEWGACPAYVNAHNDAELAAIFAGLHLTVTRWPGLRRVLVRSDSKDALRRVSLRPSPARSPATEGLARKIDALIEKHALEIIPAWLRGHQTTDTRPAFINARVDALSRKARVAEQKRRAALAKAPP